MSNVVLVQASPLNASTGAATAVRLAGGGVKPYDQLGFRDWRAGVGLPLRFTAALGFEQGGPTGGAIPQSATLRFTPSDRTLLSTLGGYVWTRARITVSTGDDEAAAPVYSTALLGTVAASRVEGASLVLTVSDLSLDLAKPVAPDSFAGTGDLEGPDEAIGRVKRRSWGRVFNVEGRVLDKANNVYEFGDPSRQLQAFNAVRDKGRDAASLATVAWQGSALATLNALRAAVAPTGGGVVAPSIACVKWWTAPAGPLTADLSGEVGAGYVETGPTIANRLLATFAPTIGVANLAQAQGWTAAAAGVHVDQPSETVADLLDRLLLPLLIAWILGADGVLAFRQFTWSGPVESLIAQAVTREAVFLPLRTRTVGYQRNHRQHSDGEISAAVLASTDVAYADGTPIETLKPAQANATAGATWGTNVGNRPTNLAALTGSEVVRNDLITVDSTGTFVGIGTTGVVADNAKVSVTAGGYLANGYGTGNRLVANDQISIGANGALAGANGGQVTIIGLGYVGDLNATRSVVLAALGGAGVTIKGGAVSCALSGDYAAAVQTVEAYTGSAVLSCRVAGVGGGGNVRFVMGLVAASNTTGTNTYALMIGGGLYVNTTSNDLEITNAAGSTIFVGPAVANGDVVQVVYTGQRISFQKNGVEFYSAAVAEGLTVKGHWAPASQASWSDSRFEIGSNNTWAATAGSANRPADNADVTALSEQKIDGLATIRIAADANGTPTVASSTHPYKRLLGGNDVSASSTWSIVSATGCTVAVDAAGIVTRSGALSASAKFTVRAVYGGVPRDLTVAFIRDDAPQTYSTGSTGGGGGNPGTSGQGGLASSTTSNAYGTAGSESAFSCVAGTAGQVALTWNIDYSITRTVNGMLTEVGCAKPQWRLAGGTWADVPLPGGPPPPTEYTSDVGAYYDRQTADSGSGTIAGGVTKTGLTAGSTYEFRMLGRRGGSTFSTTGFFSGTLNGTGS